MPAQQDLKIWQGNDFVHLFHVYQTTDPSIDFDLTGSRLLLTVDGVEALNKDSDDPDSGLSIVDAAGGMFQLIITHQETRLLAIGSVSYELERWVGVWQETLFAGALATSGGKNND